MTKQHIVTIYRNNISKFAHVLAHAK